MKTAIKLTVMLAAAVALFGADVAMQEFSADMVITTKDGGAMKGKMFVTKEKQRTEMEGAVTIARLDKNVVWVLMPEQKMYMEQPVQPQSVVAATGEKMPGELERKHLGKETVDGKQADKYKITYASDKQKTEIFQWIDVASGFPVKTAAVDGSWTQEFKNLKIGAQPASLFEIPAGYVKFSMDNIPGMPGKF